MGPLDELRRTLGGARVHGWKLVLLQPSSKKPYGRSWVVTQDQNVVTGHISKVGGNLGLLCGPSSGVAVLDFDRPGALLEMSQALGPIEPWVQTGSGKHHCYVRWEDGLPARLMWRGEKVGEVQRGPGLQHVVMPPSTHPDTKKPYTWLLDPAGELPPLPPEWRAALLEEHIPDYIEREKIGHPEDEVWGGPPPEELIRRALTQPGASRRRNGVKFQCAGCRKVGRDRSRDNATVFEDGRWGCAVDPTHSRDIGESLGVVSVAREVLGEHADELRDVSIDDLD